jgi:hypothetical protein
MLWPLLCLLEWLQNRLDICRIYIYYPAMTLHIAVIEKKLLLYHQGFGLYLKVSGISVCRHIMAKSKILVCRHMLYFVSWPAYLISWPAYFISPVSGLRYISLLAHQVTKWYLESQVFQYANISWHEQSFSMPAYHGKSQISVCQHIMAWAKFQYVNISGQEQNFSMPAYHGIDLNPQSPFISVRQHIKASINNSYRHLFRHASISRHSIILSVIANSGSVIYRDINLKANKHHISYRIRFHRVSQFSILTCLIIFAY